MAAIVRLVRRYQKVHRELTAINNTNNYPDPKAPGFKDTTGLDLPKGMRIPDWRKYDYKNHNNLSRVERALAKEGLKSPWLRNEAWRQHSYTGIEAVFAWIWILWDFMKYGIMAFIVYETGFRLLKSSDADGHGHHVDDYPLLNELKQQKSSHH